MINKISLPVIAKTSLGVLNKTALNMFTRTSLGVSISNEKIELALLRQTREGVELLKAATEPIPAGAVSDGNVKDPAVLARAIKAIRNHHKIGPRRTVVSLFAHPVLTQIIDLPPNLPSNIAKYVDKEVRHCAVLPRKNISLDYCGISSLSESFNKRLFITAAESENVLSLVGALSEAGLNVEAVEPPELAGARTLYDGKILKNLDSNVLIALVDGANVSLVVFRNQTLDFLRKRNIAGDICQSKEALDRLAEEVSAVVQYYDVEIDDGSKNWKLVTVLDRAGDHAREVGDSLQSRLSNLQVEVVSPVTACENTQVINSCGAETVSLVAVGLAMRLLNLPQPKLKVNLVPPESAEVKAVKKYALVTANIVAAVLTVMILAVGVLSASLNKTNETITQLKAGQASTGTMELLVEQEGIDNEAERLRAELEAVNKLLHSGNTGGWDLILDDIRYRTPQSLWISSLFSEDNSRLLIKGRSTSYEAVRLFVEMLGESKYMASVALVEAEKDEGVGGLVSYSIDCSLTIFEDT
ncbi:MAG: pilus assembly protein PilM [Planctomycetota bacterium]|jgi:Tfp pilus assembly PilM family ATPase/Tfp pilus assembly protein PilN